MIDVVGVDVRCKGDGVIGRCREEDEKPSERAGKHHRRDGEDFGQLRARLVA